MLDEGFQSASLTSEIAQSSSYNRAVDLEIGNDLSSGVINHDNNLTFDDISSMSTPVDGRDVNNGEETSKSNIIVSENLTYSMSEALPLLETDRNMLINASRYLLYSHNSAVVMAASQLLFYLKCKDDYPSVVRALIRTLNCNREVQYIVLSNIASLTIDHRHLFEPYLRVFFIYSTDSLQVKLLKLEILSSLISETSSSIILREFQHYVNSYDEEFVTATIQAIGRCASTVPQISDVCLGGLLRLMSRPKEKIMAECVVVLRKLLQMQTTDHKEIIMHIAQLADTITIPTAVASILWLLGEFSHRVPKIAPDILRKMVKSFSQQEPVVKYQIINLAAKLCIVNPRQTLILAQYVFNLAKYDTNYDIRDKARFLRGLLFPQITTNPNLNGDNVSHGSHKTPMKLNSTFLSKHARKICLASKPAPIIKSQFDDRSNFRLGTLSHILHRRISGYRDLSDWPIIPPDPWSRIIVTSTASKLNDNESLNINSPKSNKMYHNKSIFNDENQLRQQHKKTDQDEEDDEENDDELVDEDQEKSGKVKDTLSSFYTDHDTSNEEFTSDENNEQNNIDDNEDDEFDSDLDIQYLLQSKQSTEVIISKDIQSSSSLLLLPSNSLIGNQSDSIPYNNDTLNTMNNISVSEKLQISMKENLIMNMMMMMMMMISIEYSNDIEGKILHEDNEKSPGSVPRVGHSTDTLVSVSHSEGCFEIPGAKTDVVSPSSVLNLPKDSTNECVDYPIQIIHSPLLWYNLTNPNVNDLTGQLQYTRLVWNNHSKLIIISLKLVNQNTSTTLTNIHFDLMNTAMGRLLVDAKRIQAFEPIVELKPQSTCIVEFGVDFAGFCDSIDLDLVYEMVSNSLNFEQIKKWPICLTPPPTELIRPIDMNKKDYFIQRDKLISSESFHHHHHHHHHHFKVKDHQSTGNVVSSVDYSSQLISHLLQYINIKYQFNTLYRHSKCICDHFDCHNENLELSQSTASIDLDTSYLSIFLAGQTVADNQLCLIEFAWSPTILLNNNNNNTNRRLFQVYFVILLVYFVSIYPLQLKR
ncbi:unnamed protein product [Heterobilharzia americana]|nr:unnamed protein product [Heterobilharzia americana]